MAVNNYMPEGMRMGTSENREYISSLAGLERAMSQGKILESTALICDGDMNLHVDLYGIDGIIEKSEAVLCRTGEELKDIAIITRVGKPVCFKVISIDKSGEKVKVYLSRRAAQLECVNNYFSGLICGDIIKAKVTHLENFGAFVDIGCGISSLLSVDCISVSRISHPKDRLVCGEIIDVIIKMIDEDNERIFVSRRELLGTWEENVALFKAGQTVAGIIRSVESYGIFVELTPNLAGLAELRDDRIGNTVTVGQSAAVYIKSIIPERMKVKLVLIDSCINNGINPRNTSDKIFIDTEKITHINHWRYSPNAAPKVIETFFDEI
ncbi:MAG: S1 RNA-binding domain-containing protein [Clostridia bacterium]|nr:S1 RNA-binding domain-containing protein [Clostridia bacterium]